ncbi:hypothetical protein ACJX0J_006122, partial [Zea mays]
PDDNGEDADEHDTCIWHVIVWFVKDEGYIFFVKCAMVYNNNFFLSIPNFLYDVHLKWNCALIRALIFTLDITYYMAEGNTPSIYHISLRAFLCWVFQESNVDIYKIPGPLSISMWVIQHRIIVNHITILRQLFLFSPAMYIWGMKQIVIMS